MANQAPSHLRLFHLRYGLPKEPQLPGPQRYSHKTLKTAETKAQSAISTSQPQTKDPQEEVQQCVGALDVGFSVKLL